MKAATWQDAFTHRGLKPFENLPEINVVSLQFHKFEDDIVLATLKKLKDDPELLQDQIFTQVNPAEELGKLLARKNILDESADDFKKEAEFIYKHCEITHRKPRVGEKQQVVNELTIDVFAIYSEDKDIKLKFMHNIDDFPHYQYFQYADVPNDIVIPQFKRD